MYERGKPDSGFKATRDRGGNPASEVSETLALVPLAGLMAPALCDLPAKAWTRLDVTRSRLARRWSAFPNGFGRTTKHT